MPGSIKAKVIRATRVDVCGNPVSGSNSVVVSGGFTEVQSKGAWETGTEFYTKNAFGQPCINDIDPNILKRYDLTINFCDVSPALYELTTGYRLITDGTGNPIGNAIAEVSGLAASGAGFALELWSKVAGSACGALGGYKWFHWLWPFVKNGVAGDFTFSNTALTFPVTAISTRNYAWGAGPYEQWAPAVGYEEHLLYQLTNVDPPNPTLDQYGNIGYGSLTAEEQVTVGTLSAALTLTATTALPITAAEAAVPSGTTVTVTDPTGAHTMTFTTTASAAAGATSLTVTSVTPTFAYPAGSTVSEPESMTPAAA